MQMTRIQVQLPLALKRKLDVLRSQGYTAAGYIRSLLERALRDDTATGKKGR